MGAAAEPDAGTTDPRQLTFRFTHGPDAWVTAQINEIPSAISQGASEHEAYLNVLDALHDLTHKPTSTERIAFAAQALLDQAAEDLEELGHRLRQGAQSAIRNLGRDRVPMRGDVTSRGGCAATTLSSSATAVATTSGTEAS